MKIGIDARLWNQTGVGRYIRNLVFNLADLDEKNEYVIFVRSEDEDEVKSKIGKNWKIIIANIPWHGVEEQLKFPKLLNIENLDLVHFPYFSVPLRYHKPFVITVHDLIVNKYNTGRASTLPLPLYYLKRFGYHVVLGSAIGRAKAIFVPSLAVVDSMRTEYPALPDEKIKVTYEGGFGEKIKEEKPKLQVEDPYILRVGNFYPHKNVQGLIKSFSEIVVGTDSKLKLVLVGKKDHFYYKIEKLIEKLGIGQSVIFIENPTDDELVYLYKHAVSTIVPSFEEGFSLTTVEAMSVGSPVLASDISVHREICQDGALYFNPNDEYDLRNKIREMVDMKPEDRKKIIEKGKKRAKEFSWRKMAEETLSIYEL